MLAILLETIDWENFDTLLAYVPSIFPHHKLYYTLFDNLFVCNKLVCVFSAVVCATLFPYMYIQMIFVLEKIPRLRAVLIADDKLFIILHH